MIMKGRPLSNRYSVYDHFFQRNVDHFKDQDRLLSFLHAQHRYGVEIEHYSILWNNEYLATGIDARLHAWLHRSFDVELRCRMKGSDIMGIEEFLDAYGWSINVIDTAPQGVLDYHRYVGTIRKGDHAQSETGATKLEALAAAFVAADWSPPQWRL